MRKVLLLFFLFIGCTSTEKNLPRIGFLDFIEDDTIAKAKQGFIDALNENGYTDGEKIDFIYANAQGDIPTLSQSCDYILSKDVELIATNVTLSTITTVQRTSEVPIFMMVSPTPENAGLLDETGNAPVNLFGVYETLEYLDIAVELISNLSPSAKRIGTIYNQAEPQSVMAFDRLKNKCTELDLELIPATVSNSSETQLITQSLINKDVDAFFALPDNIIFASFETIVAACDKADIPIYTSEAGLVARGAVASYGADFYQWGFQAGLQAVQYLEKGNTNELSPEIVKTRIKMLNKNSAERFNIIADTSFVVIE